MLNLEWPDIHIGFDNARRFKYESISLFWCLENLLAKDKTDLPFQIIIA